MSDRLLASTRKGLFTLVHGSRGWSIERVSFLAENATLALVDPRDGGWYAALNLGHFGVKLKYSSNSGETWEDRAVPEYPEGAMVVTADGKPPKPATLNLLWALEAGTEGQSGRLWAGTLPGGLFKSDDGGKSWSLVTGLWDHPSRANWFGGGADLPGIHSICLDPRNQNTIRLAVSCGGAWISEDDGATWRINGEGMYADFMPPDRKFDPTIQDAHYMVQCRSNPDHLWVQHHNGIFRSTDGGVSWNDVPNARPSVFGFAVAVHPNDPLTAWFVPAVKDERRVPVDGKLVVSRTRDGGKTFDVLSNGLPQSAAYDIVYRHALAIDSTGDRLAFGSTTGGVWTTDNQGDTWAPLLERLPPIHAMCYA